MWLNLRESSLRGYFELYDTCGRLADINTVVEVRSSGFSRILTFGEKRTWVQRFWIIEVDSATCWIANVYFEPSFGVESSSQSFDILARYSPWFFSNKKKSWNTWNYIVSSIAFEKWRFECCQSEIFIVSVWRALQGRHVNNRTWR